MLVWLDNCPSGTAHLPYQWTTKSSGRTLFPPASLQTQTVILRYIHWWWVRGGNGHRWSIGCLELHKIHISTKLFHPGDHVLGVVNPRQDNNNNLENYSTILDIIHKRWVDARSVQLPWVYTHSKATTGRLRIFLTSALCLELIKNVTINTNRTNKRREPRGGSYQTTRENACLRPDIIHSQSLSWDKSDRTFHWCRCCHWQCRCCHRCSRLIDELLFQPRV